MRKIKFILVSILVFLSVSSANASVDCGQVDIENILAGPRHGAMVQVNNPSCGFGGWVCLDPDGQHMSVEESKRLYTFVLIQYMQNRPIKLSFLDGVYASACGSNYPIVEDVRAK